MDLKRRFQNIFHRKKMFKQEEANPTNDMYHRTSKDVAQPSPIPAQAEVVAKNTGSGIDTPQPARLFHPPAYTDIPSAEHFARMTNIPTVSTADASKLLEPDNLKVAVDFNGPPSQLYPVLRWGEYTYWPLSYIDNRYAMAIVVTDSAGRIIKTIEARGARYIRDIQVDSSALEVGFIGQANHVATLQWNHLFISLAANERPLMDAHSSEPPRTAIPTITVEESLTGYFQPRRSKYTDEDFDGIATLLERSEFSKYSKSPRLYTVLRYLECEKDLDNLLRKGLSDSSLPLSRTQLPSDFSEGWKTRFHMAQRLVCDNSQVVQMMNLRKHTPLSQPPNCFQRLRFFGRGGRGEVDEVLYSITFKHYARKRMRRPNMSNLDTTVMAAFKNEVDSMKRIVHRHCVELVASYTDPSVFAILMLPVADCNLSQYLQSAASSADKLSFLPEFFGCLARGLWHIHRQQLRHRDIKPENVLVHDHKVLFTDFDCSLNWSHTMHSTTVEVPPRTKEYASPEVARSGFVQNTRINSASDIWSLGCVFLEIVTVWKGRLVQELDDIRISCYCNNSDSISQWIEKLQTVDSDPSKNEVLGWIREMLHNEPEKRPTTHKLVEMTSEFCCIECKGEDQA